MKIAISGASGFVGGHLSAYLQERGHEVAALARSDFAEDSAERLARIISECDAVVNLAGAPIDRRWSETYKKELLSSRIDVTRRLVAAIGRSERTRVLVSASAVGYYPAAGCHDETEQGRGSDFLARLCQAWETEARKVRVRCAITRFGVVLSPDGGAFPRLARPARWGMAVVPGGGSQPFAWIAIEDLVRAEEFLLMNDHLEGVFNFTAPESISMRELVRAAAKRYRSLLTVHVPGFALRLALGGSARTLLEGQCAVPRRLLEAGFGFETPALSDFIKRL